MTEDVEALKRRLVRRASRSVLGGFRPPADAKTPPGQKQAGGKGIHE